MNETRVILGKIDQIFASGSRRRPDPRLTSSAVPPNGLLYVRGWLCGTTGAQSALTLDDGPQFPCAQGNPRPDVDQALGSLETLATEFEAFVDVPPLGDGLYRLSLVAFGGESADTLDSVPIRVHDPRPRTTLAPVLGGVVNIDRIRIGSRELGRDARALVPSRDELVKIEGWAISGIVSRAGALLYALIDDCDAIPASYGAERADVAAASGTIEALRCGFRIIIDPSPYAMGTHIVRFVVVMDDGIAYACADSLALCLES